MKFKSIFNRQDIKFMDRTDIIETVKLEYQHLSFENNYYKVLSIYGMGGIGKSRLLSEIKKILDERMKAEHTNITILNLSLEIADSTILLNAIVHLRGQIPYACPLFDYAFFAYWNRVQVTKLNEDYFKTVKSQWFEYLKDFGALISIPLSGFQEFVNIPLDKMAEIAEKTFQKVKTTYYSHIFNGRMLEISSLTAKELYSSLGGLLGMEINRLYHNKKLIIIVDAYKQFSDTTVKDWLLDLVESSYTGLFIIAGREKIRFPFLKKNELISYELKELPEEEASKLLLESIPGIDTNSVRNIVSISDGIPIYLELAINTYQSTDMLHSPHKAEMIFYKDKNEIIDRFFSHLPENEREFMLGLSFVQVFDREIFLMLLSLFPTTTCLAYDDIHSLSLVTNIENEENLYKIHNVIHNNVIHILPYDTRYDIFQKYLNHIASRTIFGASDNQIIILYKHLIQLIIDNEFNLQTNDTERLLDIFFTIKQTRIVIMPVEISDFSKYEPLKDVYWFTKAISEERADTKVRVSYLEKIDSSNNYLGKHNKSLQIISGYLNQWLGDGTILVSNLQNIIPTLKSTEIREWYYAQAIIFMADHHTIIGNFKQAKAILEPFQEEIRNYPEQENSIFQSLRHMGHMYRFNLLFDDAKRYYLATQDTNHKYKNSIQEVYIRTNLCETDCYLLPDFLYKENCFSGLKLAKTLDDAKSMAKIYYSMAIAYIHLKKYKLARKYIHKSLYYSKKDGYELGLLSPMLAELYLQYALGQPLQVTNFRLLLDKVKVYQFLWLPVAIMQNDDFRINEIHSQFEWIDFDQTLKTYNKFFTLIES
ncbi:MAG: hypothetical protein LUI87_03385 [Lachnospiraceae bacterium]|nr:hypothetical protein [Lachnospiraceae bacterium]